MADRGDLALLPRYVAIIVDPASNGVPKDEPPRSPPGDASKAARGARKLDDSSALMETSCMPEEVSLQKTPPENT